MQPNKPILIALMGPTASGKTELAIDIAKKLNSNIHNIDSRQIYIDMNIGTAKPTQDQQQKAHHCLIDLSLPSKPLNFHDFQSIASESIEKELKKQKLVFLVGGSGLYFQGLIKGLRPPAVGPQKFLRDQLEKIDKIELYKLLKCCDPLAAKQIHQEDKIRIVRALEVFYATGERFSNQKNLKPPKWKILELGLNPENLKMRIEQRTKQMYRYGLIEETEQLIIKYGNDLKLLKTIGYGEARSIIKGHIDQEEAIAITIQRTCQLAKRQKTWFRNKHNAKWLNDKSPYEHALFFINEFIS